MGILYRWLRARIFLFALELSGFFFFIKNIWWMWQRSFTKLACSVYHHHHQYMRDSSDSSLAHTESLMSSDDAECYRHSPDPSGCTTEETISGPGHWGGAANHSWPWQQRQQGEMALTCIYTPHLKGLVFTLLQHNQQSAHGASGR